MSGSGVYPFAYSTRGSGFSNLAGLIWPEELEACFPPSGINGSTTSGVERFRVLELGPVIPPQVLHSRARLAHTGCATLE
jgi:hypothetical protein